MMWCRDDVRIVNGVVQATNHHPRCEYVDESLIDVWTVCIPGETGGCVTDNEASAREMAGEDPGAPLEVIAGKMHREIFEQLGEFNGF